MTDTLTIQKVCSANPGAFTKGHDTFHLTADRNRTFCGRKCDEWLRMGELEDHEINSAYLCQRCHAKATA